MDVDVAAFERLAAEDTPAALERASALYEGDLLLGLNVREEAFEEWLGIERERLRQRGIAVLTRLLNLHVAHERYETAVVPGRFFGMPDHFRLGIGGTRAALEGGLERLGAVLDELSRRR